MDRWIDGGVEGKKKKGERERDGGREGRKKGMIRLTLGMYFMLGKETWLLCS